MNAHDRISTMADCQITPPDYLNFLYGGLPGDNWLEFTYIAPFEVSGPRVFTQAFKLGTDRPDWPQVDALNAAGYGVYYSLTTKKRRTQTRASEADTRFITCLWVDIDLQDGVYSSLDQAYNALCDHVPSVIINSGGGLHGIWKIAPMEATPENAAHVKQTLRGLALATKGDPHVAELARVFRLPGYQNTKPERHGSWCTIWSFVPGVMHYDLFEEYYTMAAPLPRTAPIRRSLPDGARLDVPRWVRDYLENGAAPGDRNNRLFAATIAYRDNGYSQTDARRDLGARASADGLADDEIERTITSAWRSTLGGNVNVAPHHRAIMQTDDDNE